MKAGNICCYFREKCHNSRKYALSLSEKPLEFIAHVCTCMRLQYMSKRPLVSCCGWRVITFPVVEICPVEVPPTSKFLSDEF